MTRHYELLVVYKPTLTEEELSAKISSQKEIMEKNGASIASLIDMGQRKLAYQVQKFERGVYKVFYFTAPTSSILEIERLIRLNEDIIKFLTVKFETKKEIASWEKMANIKKEETPA